MKLILDKYSSRRMDVDDSAREEASCSAEGTCLTEIQTIHVSLNSRVIMLLLSLL
jgi:hypothetical protein